LNRCDSRIVLGSTVHQPAPDRSGAVLVWVEGLFRLPVSNKVPELPPDSIGASGGVWSPHKTMAISPTAERMRFRFRFACAQTDHVKLVSQDEGARVRRRMTQGKTPWTWRWRKRRAT